MKTTKNKIKENKRRENLGEIPHNMQCVADLLDKSTQLNNDQPSPALTHTQLLHPVSDLSPNYPSIVVTVIVVLINTQNSNPRLLIIIQPHNPHFLHPVGR